MPRGRLTSQDESPQVSVTCEFCDPPDDIKAQLGSAIGQYRYRHYMTFPSTDSLDQHFKTFVQPFPAPEKGYNYEQWKSGVLHWHRQRLAMREQEARRALDASYVGPDTRFDRES